MKVGLVSPYDFASPGGVTDHVRYLAKSCANSATRHRSLRRRSRTHADSDGTTFHRLGTRSRSRSTTRWPHHAELSLANRVQSLVERERFDVLHFHEPLMPAKPMTLLRLSTTANVGTFHAFSRSNAGYQYGRRSEALPRKTASGHRGERACTHLLQSLLLDFPLRIIPNGIDTRFTDRAVTDRPADDKMTSCSSDASRSARVSATSCGHTSSCAPV